jgi:hypothetical protein
MISEAGRDWQWAAATGTPCGSPVSILNTDVVEEVMNAFDDACLGVGYQTHVAAEHFHVLFAFIH